MKKSIIIFWLLFSTWGLRLQAQSAEGILSKTLEAMGGKKLWSDMEYISLKGAGHKYWLEQSENPNGPFITTYELIEETRAVHKHQLSRKETTHQFLASAGSKSEIMVNGNAGVMKFGERTVPMPYQLRTGHDEWMRYAPEKLLFTALNNSPALAGKVSLEGTEHYRITFSENGLAHSLYINIHNYLLGEAVIETYMPTDIFNYPWGRFETRIHYSVQWIYPDNIRYPSQWDIYKLGKHYRSITIQEISFGAEVDPELFGCGRHASGSYTKTCQ